MPPIHDIWRGKKCADNKGAEQNGCREKGRRAKWAQSKKGARSRCCVTVTFKVVISCDNRVFFCFFFCRNIIHSLRLPLAKKYRFQFQLFIFIPSKQITTQFLLSEAIVCHRTCVLHNT